MLDCKKDEVIVETLVRAGSLDRGPCDACTIDTSLLSLGNAGSSIDRPCETDKLCCRLRLSQFTDHVMKVVIIIFLLLLTGNAYTQTIHNLRFVHVGIEDKPIGTLSISVEKLIHPNNREADLMFGKAIKTDIKTFTTLIEVLKSSKLLSAKSDKINNELNYEILGSDGLKLYLNYRNTTDFFQNLRNTLVKNKRDNAVITAFKHY